MIPPFYIARIRITGLLRKDVSSVVSLVMRAEDGLFVKKDYYNGVLFDWMQFTNLNEVADRMLEIAKEYPHMHYELEFPTGVQLAGLAITGKLG